MMMIIVVMVTIAVMAVMMTVMVVMMVVMVVVIVLKMVMMVTGRQFRSGVPNPRSLRLIALHCLLGTGPHSRR